MKKKHFIDKSLVKKIDEDIIEYGTYIIHRSGSILDHRNRTVKINQSTGNVRLVINGVSQIKKGGRLIYELFNDVELTHSDIIIFNDGDETNIALDNITIVSRKDYFDGHEWNYKFNNETQNRIKEGHKQGKTIHQLASDYDCCDVTIWKILNEQYVKGKSSEA